MAQKGKSTPLPDLLRAVSADHIPLRETIRVSKADAAELAEALRTGARKVAGVPFDLRRAIGTLARSAPDDPETGRILAGMVVDQKQPMSARLAAVSHLGTLSSAQAEEPLLRALRGAGGPYRHALLRALAQVGTSESYAVLRDAKPESEADGRQLALARVAIAARDKGIVGPALDESFGLSWEETSAAPLDRKSIAAIRSSLTGSLFSIRPSEEVALGYTCGDSDFALMANDELDAKDLAAALMDRDRIAGVLVSQAARGANWTLRLLVLTQPEKDRLRMVLTRPNGDPVYEGTGERGKDGLEFRLRDTGLERNPAEIHGRVSGKTLSWTHRIWRGPLTPKRRPVALPAPAARAPAVRRG